ncbi:MAG: hypothetical protein ABIB04_00270 [Patescibacteria group bacterium]
MRKPLNIFILIFFGGFFVFCGFVRAMTSTNYRVNWDSINSGGLDIATSTNYNLHDTIGEQATGYTTSSNYTLSAGYRTGDKDETYLTFRIGTQEPDSAVSYSVFDNVGISVTVSSASGFSVGDIIGVVEDVGLSQLIAIGKITDITGTVITVDKWDGVPGSLSLNPGGGDDFVYRINGNSVAFGTLTNSIAKTSLTGTRVTSNAVNGYTVYVNTDDDLRYGTTNLQNVSDGAVTIGSEEYGWQTYGSSATSTGSDHAFTTLPQEIQYSTTTASIEERVGLVYKISISNSTPAGNYSQSVFYTLTANY